MAKRTRLEPSLKLQLDAGRPGPFKVVVTFKDELSPERLQQLGLYGSGGSSSTGFGELSHDALQALARDRGVTSIVPAELLPAPPEPARTSPPFASKVAPDLALRLLQQPEEPQQVAVTFEPTPDPAELAALGLSPTGGSLAMGLLTRTAVEALAARPDVTQLSWLGDPWLNTP